MEVNKMIALARQGDEYGFEFLDAHYEPILKKYITKNYGEDNAMNFIELMPSLIKKYFEEESQVRFDKYLKKNANNLYKEKKVYIGKYIDKDDFEKKEKIIKHYSLVFYNKILKYKDVLKEEELKKFSYEFIKDSVFKLTETKCEIIPYFANLISRELKLYDKSEENLLKRYIIYVGLNENILNYYIKKYNYLLDKYKNNRMYNCLCCNYKNLVKKSLKSLNNINIDIQNVILENLIKEFNLQKEKEKNLLENEKDSEESFKCLYDNYSYIKNNVFNKFNSLLNLDDKTLKEEIERKYNDFIKAYLNGKRTTPVQRYLNTRLSEYFNNLSKKKTKQENKINNCTLDKEELIFLNKDLVDLAMKKLKTQDLNNTIRNMIKKYYFYSYDEYIKKNRKTSFRVYAYNRLVSYVEQINDIRYINSFESLSIDMKERLKNTNIINSDIFDLVYDSWVSYYIDKKIYKETDFDEFIIYNLLNYDEDCYREIINVKNHINCKVLKRQT